jgi:Undecaprenyl-phosphate galactose phosphotransferase WbaP
MSTATVGQIKSVSALAGFSIRNPHRRGLSAMIVLAADVVGLRLTLWAFLGNTIIGRHAAPGAWLQSWQLLPLFLVLYWLLDSYPGVSVSPVDEIRRISLANISAFLFVSVMLALHQSGVISQLSCLSACVVATVVILTMRAAVRQIGSQFDWWGYPVVLFGGGATALLVLRKLKSQPHLGLRPVAVVTNQVADSEMEGVSVYKSEYLDRIASSGVRHAIVAAPELPQSEFADVLERCGDAFPHLILIPDTDFIWRVGSYTRDLMGVLGHQARNNLLHSGSRIAKRAIDIACSAVLTSFLLPLILVISLLVVVESGFPVFYSQKRLGHEGRIFHIWKFRTMAQNSTEVLERCLASRSDLRKEWAEDQKLRNDPRISRVGRVLRITSLDELPQLWNVIKGEMSLVGPRPIVEAEVAKYKEAYSLVAKAPPGLTGLWQVSGRNHTTYAERIAYDTYYVRNWSVWMDIYLLAKTVGVVLSGDGAY